MTKQDYFEAQYERNDQAKASMAAGNQFYSTTMYQTRNASNSSVAVLEREE
jgi:hypothetical protein